MQTLSSTHTISPPVNGKGQSRPPVVSHSSAKRQISDSEDLAKLTAQRNHVLDRWANPRILELNAQEVALNMFLKRNLKYLFGQTGFNPPVPARNPISTTMHNPRFSTALWAINTDAYQRKGHLSRSRKEVVALAISLANNCPHCAFIHTAMGPAAGADVQMEEMQCLYQTRDVEASFGRYGEEDPFNRRLAEWAIKHRDGENRQRMLPCTADQAPEALGTVFLFSVLNRCVDAFVSREEYGPMFPLPIRMLMKYTPAGPMVQRMMSKMMTWMMYAEDGKVQAGDVLRNINKVTPIVNGFEGAEDRQPHLELPSELSWAKHDPVLSTTFAFMAREAELMAEEFVPRDVKTYMRYWVSCWDGSKAPSPVRSQWLEPEIMKSMFDLEKEQESVALLRVLLVTVVASYDLDDDFISACQQYHGFRGTHAAIMWAAFLAAQRLCELISLPATS